MKRHFSESEARQLLWGGLHDEEDLGDFKIEEELIDQEDDIVDEVSEDEGDIIDYPEYAAIGQDESTDDDDDEEEEEEELSDVKNFFQSKDGSLLWSPTPLTGKNGVSEAQKEWSPGGPTLHAVSHAQSILAAFELFFPESITNLVLEMTNKEGQRVYGTSWSNMDLTDLRGYLGLLILSGVYRCNKETVASLWHAEHGRSIFRATMPHKTFSIISRVLCFDDRATRATRRATDKLAAIRDLWDKWVCLLPMMYTPGSEVTVDERLVPFRGRCPFRQCMPSNLAKCGIKIWTACDVRTSYAWNMEVYTGKPADGQSERNQGMRVVLQMTEGLQGQTITCNHLFTSYALGQVLLDRKLTMVGRVRRNKPELPPALLATRERARLSSLFAFTDTCTLVSYCPKKREVVTLMSTSHQEAAVSDREDKKPQIILDYDANKGGVDNLSKVTQVYSCKMRTARWPLLMFFNMIDVSAYNSFVLWVDIVPTWNWQKYQKRRLFLEELGRELVLPLIKRRQFRPRTVASASLVTEIQRSTSIVPCEPSAIPGPPPRKRCRFCKNDSKTSIRCHKCNTHVCKRHSLVFCHACL